MKHRIQSWPFFEYNQTLVLPQDKFENCFQNTLTSVLQLASFIQQNFVGL